MIKHWLQKFQNAFAGVYWGTIGESSFLVHGIASVLVVSFAFFFECATWEWVALLLCVGGVFALELMNSALEHLAKGLCQEQNIWVGRALDIASASILCFSAFSVVIGCIIFVPKALSWLSG